MKRRQAAKKMLALLLSGTMILGMSADVLAAENVASESLGGGTSL